MARIQHFGSATPTGRPMSAKGDRSRWKADSLRRQSTSWSVAAITLFTNQERLAAIKGSLSTRNKGVYKEVPTLEKMVVPWVIKPGRTKSGSDPSRNKPIPQFQSQGLTVTPRRC